MGWKDTLKQIVIGVPLLWGFMIVAGYGLNFIETHYWVWIVGIFILAPLVLYVMPALHERSKKKHQ